MVETLVQIRQPSSGATVIPSAPFPIDDNTLRNIPGSLLPIQTEVDLPTITGIFESHSIKATPERILIGTLTNDSLLLKRPIETEIEREGSDYIASNKYLDEFGFGESPMQAIDDLRSTIVELYCELKERREVLGTDLLETLNRLGELIKEV